MYCSCSYIICILNRVAREYTRCECVCDEHSDEDYRSAMYMCDVSESDVNQILHEFRDNIELSLKLLYFILFFFIV